MLRKDDRRSIPFGSILDRWRPARRPRSRKEERAGNGPSESGFTSGADCGGRRLAKRSGVRRRSGSALLGGRGDDRVRPADSRGLEDGWTAGAVVKETRLGRVCRRGTVVPSDRRLHARPFPRYCSSATAPAGPPHWLRHLPAHVGISGKVKPSEGIGSKLFA